MHIDENKLFDRRNLEKNIKSGLISLKDFEAYLSRLPDVGEKIFNPNEPIDESEEFLSATETEIAQNKTKGSKKKTSKNK